MYELACNRVWRPFIGGMLLDDFCGSQPSEDGHYPERWICSTTKAADGSGISKTKEGILLTSLYQEPVDVLVKLLDSRTRLMIQVHPDDEKARKYFDSRFGKTECWYILDTRVIDGQEPYVYIGFKKGVTREYWESLFDSQDIKAMEACLNKIAVKKGDVFVIPGGLVHAMGTGVFFAEIQQPTDIILRTERIAPDGRVMEESELDYGRGRAVLFDCFDYTTYTKDEILSIYKRELRQDTVIDHQMFWMKDITVDNMYTVKVDKFAIVVIMDGPGKGREFFLTEDEIFYGNQRLLICGSGQRRLNEM